MELLSLVLLDRWCDVLVEAEQVGRVVALLERRQPCIGRRWVGIMDALLTFVGKEIHVHTRGIRPDCLPNLLHTRMKAGRIC